MNSTMPFVELVEAARLADPLTRRDRPFTEGVDWARVLNLLVTNKIPLLALERDPLVQNSPFYQRASFRETAERERKIWIGLREEYAAVRTGFLQRGIRNVLIKSVGLPPSFPYTSDNLDILVQPQHIESARRVLSDLGYVELRNIEEPAKFLFRKFRGGQSISAIHLHGKVGWGVPFLLDEILWENCRPALDDSLVLVPSPDDAFLITVAHAFYENKAFKLLDLVRLRHCLRERELDFGYMYQVAAERGWKDGLSFCLIVCAYLEEQLFGKALIPRAVQEQARALVDSNLWLRRQLKNTLAPDRVAMPFRISFLFGKCLYYKKILFDRRRARSTRLDDVIRTLAWGIKLKLHIGAQRGMLVSLSGIDGSGKTSHARALLDALNTSEINAQYIWKRVGTTRWLGWLSRIISGKRYENTHKDTETALSDRRHRLRSPLLRSGWLVLSLSELIITYNVQVRLPRWVGGVVVCDRYIPDAIVEIAASLPEGSAWLPWAEWLLIKLCPRPDVAWLLDVPADTVMERQADEKQGLSEGDELSHQREMYLRLAAQHGLVVLDTRIDPAKTSSRLVRDTLVLYYENYGTWLNALLLSNPRQMNPASKNMANVERPE